MPRHLKVNDQARCDLARIARFIARSVSAPASNRWYSSIERTIATLKNDAEIWPEAEEAEQFGIDLRFRMHGKKRHVYRILYTFDDETVTIHRVLHAAQDWLAELE